MMEVVVVFFVCFVFGSKKIRSSMLKLLRKAIDFVNPTTISKVATTCVKPAPPQGEVIKLEKEWLTTNLNDQSLVTKICQLPLLKLSFNTEITTGSRHSLNLFSHFAKCREDKSTPLFNNPLNNTHLSTEQLVLFAGWRWPTLWEHL
eukprot:Lithocolla_globosa_v1_NODE_1643_length_2424_cov_8.280287.p3 type:complete len:147 gc:universal NODE_1643_length_2424_cov_8.280287:844-1284(+)